MKNININLPYFFIKNNKVFENKTFRFLKNKFLPLIRKRLPNHYLINQNTQFYLRFILNTTRAYPYFLYFDIEKFFPSINHKILLNELKLNYKKMSGRQKISKRFETIISRDLKQFLYKSPFKTFGIPLGSNLSYILTGIFLLKTDLSINLPFLRYVDDYLVFGKSADQLNKALSNIIAPILKELDLSININKLYSGKFNRDKLFFLGFEFYAGYIRISKEKILQFKQKIVRITRLNRKKPIPIITKLLNNQILGFGHYYKFASCKNIFLNLDSFVRARLRRYILKNRDLVLKTGNLLLNNRSLESSGLKSLIEIKQKFDKKHYKKSEKSSKIRQNSGHLRNKFCSSEIEQISYKYKQVEILNELKILTGLVKSLDKRLKIIERKLSD